MGRKIKKKKKKRTDGDIVLKTNSFIRFLRKVWLSGIFETALFSFDEEEVSVELIDLTNSMFISCSEEVLDSITIGDSEFDLGVGDVGLLLRMFSTVSQDTVSVDKKDNRIIIKRDDGTNLSYLLTDGSVIPTVYKGESTDPVSKLLKKTDYELEIEEKLRDDFLLYMGILKTRDVGLTVKDGVVTLIGGAETEHMFKLKLGEVDEDQESFSLKFYGDFLQKVFNELDYDENNDDVEAPVIHIGEDTAIVIVQGGYTWALIPIMGE